MFLLSLTKFLVSSFILSTFGNCEVVFKKKCFSSLSDGHNCDQLLPSELIPKNFTLLLPDSYFGTVCCYEEGLECFSNKEGTPFECFPGLPDCMNKIRPDFFLYTPEMNSTSETAVQTFDFFNLDSKIDKLQINASKSTFVVIHGFGDEWPKPWIGDIKDALIALGNNVLVLRWSRGSQNYSSLFNYFKAAANARSVGAAVAKVLRTLVRHKKADLSRTTIIGYSLGAHVAGHVGRKLDGLQRIIALDPAGPLFTCQNSLARLDTTDANFVQVIHTNGDSFFNGGVGTMQPMGHIDFYANGGKLQPGCNKGPYQTLQEKFQGQINDANDDFWCSHTRAPIIFTETLRNALTISTSCKYSAFPCVSTEEWSAGSCFTCNSSECPIVGYLNDGSSSSRGKYFFDTQTENITSGEFCGSQFLVSLTSDVDVEGRIALQFHFSKADFAEITFQDYVDTLFGHKPKSSVTSSKWVTKILTGISITYFARPTGSAHDWNLINCSVTNSFGKTIQSPTIVKMKPSITTYIKLI